MLNESPRQIPRSRQNARSPPPAQHNHPRDIQPGVRLSPHRAQATPEGPLASLALRSVLWVEAGPPAGPLTSAVMAVASSLSVGWGVVVIFVFGVHLTTSAPFRVGPLRLGIRPVSHDHQPKDAGHPGRGFPLRFRRRHSLLGHPSPAGELGPPHGRLTGPQAGPRRGFRVPHAGAAAGVGALSTPGTTVLILTGVAHRPAPAASPRHVPAPRHNIPSMRGSA